VSDKKKPSRLEALRDRLETEDTTNDLDDFISPGYQKLTHTEALELRETVVEGKKVKTTKL
jgi:lipoic acid synthetase